MAIENRCAAIRLTGGRLDRLAKRRTRAELETLQQPQGGTGGKNRKMQSVAALGFKSRFSPRPFFRLGLKPDFSSSADLTGVRQALHWRLPLPFLAWLGLIVV